MASLDRPAPAQSGGSFESVEARRAAEQERIRRERQKQSLRLQRENILSQRTSNPVRRAALESALQLIEAQIQELG